jgi:hypothetical protein
VKPEHVADVEVAKSTLLTEKEPIVNPAGKVTVIV